MSIPVRNSRPYWRISSRVKGEWRTTRVERLENISSTIQRLVEAGEADQIKVVSISEAAYDKGRGKYY